MIEISGFRIRAEVEKVFRGNNVLAVKEALEAFSAFLPVQGSLAYFHHYHEQSEGNTAFLWAALVGMPNLINMGLSSKDLEFALACLYNKPDIFTHTEREVRLIAQFQVAKTMAHRQRVLDALAPYKNPAEKVRGLGFDGHKLQALGFSGFQLGELIKLLNNRMAENPAAGDYDVESWIQEFNNSVTRC